MKTGVKPSRQGALPTGISAEAVRTELEKILQSAGFANSDRLSRFLRFAVEETLQGRANELKESLIGVGVFDKKPSYDPRTDASVRVEAVKLRSRLTEYNETEGRDDAVRIEFTKGSYAPIFREQARPAGAGIRMRIWIFSVVAALVLAGFTVNWVVARSKTTALTSAGGPPSIAVLPFVNLSADHEIEYFSDGLTEELINALAKVEGLRVVARTSAFQFKGKAQDIRNIGKQLNVGAVLEGGVRKERDKLRVSAQLIQVAEGYHLWSETYERELKDVFVIQEEIAQAVVRALRIQLRAPHKTPLVKRYTDDLEVYSLYLKGRYFGNSPKPEDYPKSIRYHEEALAKDPGYAPAYAGLSKAYFFMSWRQLGPPKELCPKAKSLAMKALALDGSLAEVHVTLAQIKYLFDYDWPGAEREFQLAFELDPNNPQVHNNYGHYLSCQGRFEEALAAGKRYIELGFIDSYSATRLGMRYYYGRQWDQSIKALLQSLEIDPNVSLALSFLGKAYLEEGRYEEAIRELQRAVTLEEHTAIVPGVLMPLGHAYAVMGRKNEAIQVLNRLKELSKHMYVTAYNLAPIYAGLGQKAEALEWLEKAYEERAPNMVTIVVEPYFDSLHSEPRFHALLKKVGLEKFISWK